MRFWDSSAVVPLLLVEPGREALLALLAADPVILAWWGTRVECTAALARREREGTLPAPAVRASLERLHALAAQWQEIQPVEAVRTTAERLLRVHPLRSADSLQLAAAIVAAEPERRLIEFVSLDARLSDAAGREGFPIRGL